MHRISRSVRRHRLHVALPLVAAALLGGCASGGTRHLAEQTAPGGSAGSSDAPTHVVVANHSWERVTVYISQGSAVWRLGEVEANTERRLPLGSFSTALQNGNVFFVGRPLAGVPFRSEAFTADLRGGVPVWTIENYTASSFVIFR
jgi:hypothetical protein